MKKLWIHNFSTPLGRIYLAETEKGLAVISLPGSAPSKFMLQLAGWFRGHQLLKGGAENARAEKQLKAYLAGKLRKFNLRLDLRGGDFQKKALKKVAAIPYGKVASYGDIARRAGNPKAARAVGMANAHNRLPLVIPCHRVVGANNLGGYGGGLKMKKHLLRLEGVKFE